MYGRFHFNNNNNNNNVQYSACKNDAFYSGGMFYVIILHGENIIRERTYTGPLSFCWIQ